jgi:hypothetical protein
VLLLLVPALAGCWLAGRPHIPTHTQVQCSSRCELRAAATATAAALLLRTRCRRAGRCGAAAAAGVARAQPSLHVSRHLLDVREAGQGVGGACVPVGGRTAAAEGFVRVAVVTAAVPASTRHAHTHTRTHTHTHTSSSSPGSQLNSGGSGLPFGSSVPGSRSSSKKGWHMAW